MVERKDEVEEAGDDKRVNHDVRGCTERTIGINGFLQIEITVKARGCDMIVTRCMLLPKSNHVNGGMKKIDDSE